MNDSFHLIFALLTHSYLWLFAHSDCLTPQPLSLSDSSPTLTVWLLTNSYIWVLTNYQPTPIYLTPSILLLVRLSSPHPISLSDSSLTPKFDSSATTNYYLQYLTPRPLSLSDSLPIRTIWLHTLSQYLTPHPHLHLTPHQLPTIIYSIWLPVYDSSPTFSVWLLTHSYYFWLHEPTPSPNIWLLTHSYIWIPTNYQLLSIWLFLSAISQPPNPQQPQSSPPPQFYQGVNGFIWLKSLMHVLRNVQRFPHHVLLKLTFHFSPDKNIYCD